MKLRTGLPLVLFGLLVVLCAPQAVGGATGYVITHGVSMEPRFHTGDLAVVRTAEHYGVGDVVAYRSRTLKTVVMHRIVAVDGARFTFKGDNNSWLDPDRPTADDVVGRLVVRVPHGGVWLARATSPGVLAALTVALLVGGGGAVHVRRRTRPGMTPRHRTAAARRRSTPLVLSAPRWLRTAAAVTAVGGIGLAALAWTGPVATHADVAGSTGRTMTFAYRAVVPPTAAYDGTTVTSPDPVFRRLADTVDVQLAYRGVAGRMSVAAELSTASGWHSAVPLAAEVDVAGDAVPSDVRLDLATYDARARAAAAATGIPVDQLTVDIVASVRSPGLPEFAPALHLALSALQLRILGDDAALRVVDPGTVTHRVDAPRSLVLGNLSMRVELARVVGPALVLMSLVLGAALVVMHRQTLLPDEDAAIRRRYGSLLVVVQPMVTPATRPVVDVTEFATLAKIAERYGLLVLHWTRSGVGTFVVQDEGTTYRYRASAGAGRARVVGADADASGGIDAGAAVTSDAASTARSDANATADLDARPPADPGATGPLRWLPVTGRCVEDVQIRDARRTAAGWHLTDGSL